MHFLNNQFFEIPEDTLWSVLDALLGGEYKVQSAFLGRKSVKIVRGHDELLPERITSSAGIKDKYRELPKQFSQPD